MSAATELRAWLITQIKADAGVQATALGATPRVFNRVPAEGAPGFPAFPFLRIGSSSRPFETVDQYGEEHTVSVWIEGDYFGDKEGETVFAAVRALLRDAAPVALSSHRLVNLEFVDEGVAAGEAEKRYHGLQRWRAVTEETA